MNDRHLLARLAWLRRILRRIAHLEHEVWIEFVYLMEEFFEHFGHGYVPAAPRLSATLGDFMSKVTLTLTLPTVMSDGTALDPTNIGTVVYQKTALTTDSPPVAGPQTILKTATALAGIGPLPEDLTYIDLSPVDGDTYTAYVTDLAGDIGDLSNSYTVPHAPAPARPGAPVLTATYTP